MPLSVVKEQLDCDAGSKKLIVMQAQKNWLWWWRAFLSNMYTVHM